MVLGIASSDYELSPDEYQRHALFNAAVEGFLEGDDSSIEDIIDHANSLGVNPDGFIQQAINTIEGEIAGKGLWLPVRYIG